MCGIVGYVGSHPAAPIILQGLEKLEYRGYDSAGLAILNAEEICVKKCKGRLQELIQQTDNGKSLPGVLGIGHTRWATHGEPSDRNSHPHLSQDGRFAVVHNGIIENYQELRAFLEAKGYRFLSDTDSEVIAHLFEFYDRGDPVETLHCLRERLEGSYAIGVLARETPDRIYCCRKDAPLIVGRGQGENYFASDIPALLRLTRECYILEDREIAALDAQSITFFDVNRQVLHKEIFHVHWDIDAAEKDGFEHFMMKEIYEQPKALRDTLRPLIQNNQILIPELDETSMDWKNLRSVYLVGCGSAYHVGMLGQNLFERRSKIPARAVIASEFRYSDPLVGPEDLVIFISQSGETADTAAALRLAKEKGARTLALVNVVGSTLAREADHVLYIWAGPEISVATTKAYTCQAAALFLLGLQLAKWRGQLSDAEEQALCRAFTELPDAFAKALQLKDQMQHFASQVYNRKDVYFIGRSLDYALSLEGCLKLKEISYIHSEATPAGELKHGPISLIEKGTLVIALTTWDALFEKTFSNIREIESRGADLLLIGTEDRVERLQTLSGEYALIPSGLPPMLQTLLAIVPLQMLSYFVAVLRGCDVDKPRNLAKSVTVE